MPGVGARVIAATDQARAVDTLVLAFAADPMARWSWPDPHQYLTHMPVLTRAFGRSAFAAGSVLGTEDYSGVALWLPPGTHPDEVLMGQLIEDTVPASIRTDMLGVFEQMGRCHPGGPHWYLPLIGVDPARQGQGLGSALMAYALERSDREGVPAYLESSNPRNISLYRRHGFEALGSMQVGSSPSVVPMLRQPR